MDKKECVLLKMYGDGKQFTRPVWYSCGKCLKCERESDDNMVERIFYCTICRRAEEALTVCKRVRPYVDEIIVIYQHLAWVDIIEEFKKLNAHLYLTEWKDDFSLYRNQYILQTGEIIKEKGYDSGSVWMLITDCDEIPSIMMLDSLKHVINEANLEYSGKGATSVTFNAHDVIVKGGETGIDSVVRLLEDYDKDEILYNHVSDSYKEVLIKYNSRLQYSGVVHHMIHGTGLKFMRASNEYYYDHIKTEIDMHVHGCRNYFIGGGGINEKTLKWKELREICDRCSIFTWKQMKDAMMNGKIDERIKRYFISHKNDSDSHIDSELRSFYTYYSVLHPDEVIFS